MYTARESLFFCRSEFIFYIDYCYLHLLTPQTQYTFLSTVQYSTVVHVNTESAFSCPKCTFNPRSYLGSEMELYAPLCFKVFHRIQTPERLYASIFDGHQFAYKNMALSEDEICHDPLGKKVSVIS